MGLGILASHQASASLGIVEKPLYSSIHTTVLGVASLPLGEGESPNLYYFSSDTTQWRGAGHLISAIGVAVLAHYMAFSDTLQVCV